MRQVFRSRQRISIEAAQGESALDAVWSFEALLLLNVGRKLACVSVSVGCTRDFVFGSTLGGIHDDQLRPVLCHV